MQAFQQYKGKKVSICTTCANRNEALREAYGTWILQDCDEIVILDWNSNTPVLDTLYDYWDPRTRILRYNGDKQFSLPIAKNTAVRCSKNDYLFMIDCDVRINNRWSYFICPFVNNVFYTGFHGAFQKPSLKKMEGNKCINGTCFLPKKMFQHVNGYNEYLEGYGFHDQSLYIRLSSRNYYQQFVDLSGCFIEHIRHPRKTRYENYDRKDTDDAINKSVSDKTDEEWMKGGEQLNLEIEEITLDKSAISD